MAIEKELRKEVRVAAGLRFGRNLPTPQEIRKIAGEILESALRQKKECLDESRKESIVESVCDDLLGLGPLQKFMDDSGITEIMVNGPYNIYIEKNGKKSLSEAKFDDEDHLRNVIEKMMGSSNRRLDESSPYVDFSLKDGSRVNVIIPPLAVDGSYVTIRKFLDTIGSVDDLVKIGTLDKNMALFLKAAIQAKLNILFSGATGSGKTTTLGVLCNELPPEERILTIEDAIELQIDRNHVLRLLTRSKNIEGKGEVGVRQLFSNSLRMRPSRIILGEIRGEEAMDLLQAVNSGHDGTLAVLHASTAADALGRLETMAMYAGLNLPSTEIRRQIASGIHLILQHEQLPDGSRKVTAISEIMGYRDGNYLIQDLFRYEMEDLGVDGKISGHFKITGKPALFHKFKKKAVKFDESIFNG